ncbi:MAG: hypothetical protein AVDCRST_MAG89-2944 [uncultured Gemmatimonadetes bacterium]|uniref:Uncharacterized protein n=1 Tax=uncultured Gemmatimonadota bacterium TaxID=203437 RepID=A0A6J4M361_9BACT|nr:MAG: hypothetical protein AVDCRST_MAG89-2944 [uncultured Gemmatimonadota bacterium]
MFRIRPQDTTPVGWVHTSGWAPIHVEVAAAGEKIGLSLLQEMSLTFNEDDAFFEITRLDGNRIRIFDGKVVPAL